MNGEDRASLDVLRAEVIGRLEVLLSKIESIETIKHDHEKRLRALEGKKLLGPAQATVIAATIGALAAIIVRFM